MSLVEPLESRTLMHTAVQSLRADNRGEAIVTLTDDALASSVTSSSVMVFVGGTDKVLGTADDVRVLASIKYTASNRRITIKTKPNLPADTGYMIKIFGSRLRALDGDKFDGEFTGTFPSGNGLAGGDFRIQTKKDRTAKPQVRFSTTSGVIDVEMFNQATSTNIATPQNVAHFLGPANLGQYDSIFVHRRAQNFVVQFGGLNLDLSGNVGQVPSVGGVDAEPGNSNVTGTIAFALGGGVADNEFFFNIVDNDGSGLTPNLDDASNGGPFTVFGRVISGMSTLTAINGLDAVNLNSQLGGLGSSVNEVPINANPSNPLNPLTDFVIVRRIAVRMKLAAVA